MQVDFIKCSFPEFKNKKAQYEILKDFYFRANLISASVSFGVEFAKH